MFVNVPLPPEPNPLQDPDFTFLAINPPFAGWPADLIVFVFSEHESLPEFLDEDNPDLRSAADQLKVPSGPVDYLVPVPAVPRRRSYGVPPPAADLTRYWTRYEKSQVLALRGAEPFEDSVHRFYGLTTLGELRGDTDPA